LNVYSLALKHPEQEEADCGVLVTVLEDPHWTVLHDGDGEGCAHPCAEGEPIRAG